MNAFTLKTLPILLSLGVTACLSGNDSDNTMTDSKLRQVLEARYVGDRSGTCVAAAFIEGEKVSRATACADPAQHRLDGSVALEIGSVSKTMTAALLAALTKEGTLRLDDPLTMHLPAAAHVPGYAGQPILLKHLVTHTSGLPSIPSTLPLSDTDNPYASLTETQVIDALAGVTLDRAPGVKWEYSNFGFMLLSYVVSHTAGTDFETLARDRLFHPLGMMHTYISQSPAGVTAAIGHLANSGQPASAWDFPVNLAGAGGVRATLDDMILYAQAQLGHGDTNVLSFLNMTHDAVDLGVPREKDDPEMGMAWVRAKIANRTVLAHDGGTGGFSSVVAIDSEQQRAVVILADTGLSDMGGVDDVALYLLDPSAALPAPRRVAAPTDALLQSLAARYHIEGFGDVTLQRRDQTLVAILPDGSEIELGFDSYGDFYPLSIAGLMTPMHDSEGKQTFVWIQGGVPVQATRLDP